MKICKDCIHYVAPKYSQTQDKISDPKCHRDKKINLVTGEHQLMCKYDCYDERSTSGICGVDGKFFESKYKDWNDLTELEKLACHGAR